MALIECIECGKEISDKATACPHCGYEAKRIENVSVSKKIINKRIICSAVALTLVIVFILGYFSLSSNKVEGEYRQLFTDNGYIV